MTTLDADQYRANYSDVKYFTNDKTPKERYEFIGMLAIVTNVPILIIASYIGEIYGFDLQLIDFIDRLKVFYHIDSIVNVRRLNENR